MKKIFYLAVMALLSIGFIACEKEDEKGNETPKTEETNNDPKMGKLTVTSEENFSDTAYCSYVINGDKIDISLLEVKFSNRMPMAVSPVLEGIPCAKDENGDISFEIATLVPTLNGAPFNKFIATDVKGSIKNGKISFSLNFGQYPTEFIEY